MDKSNWAWVNGLIGVLIFSGSLPATRIGVLEFDPVFFTVARGAVAGILALGILAVLRQRLPQRRDIPSLVLVSVGVIVGFPLMTAFALQHVTSAHSTVFIGLLPLVTACFGVLRAGERPGPIFWVFSVLGSSAVVGYALLQGGEGSLIGDFFMLAAIVVCGLGYAEGGRLSRTLGGWQVICWALVLSLPLMLTLSLVTWPAEGLQSISTPAWFSLGYVSLFSMLIGIVFWYTGLAQGGIASIGQLQLLQPFFGLVLAALLLGEEVSLTMVLITCVVVLCVVGSRRFSERQKQVPTPGDGTMLAQNRA